MKWLSKIRLFKRIRNQERVINALRGQLEALNAPVFYVGEGQPIRPWRGNEPNLEPFTLEDKLKLGLSFCEDLEGKLMDDFLLVLYTDKGIFRKMLTYNGEREVHVEGENLTASCTWPSIKVGQEVTVHYGAVCFCGKLMTDIPDFRNTRLYTGESITVKYTFSV